MYERRVYESKESKIAVTGSSESDGSVVIGRNDYVLPSTPSSAIGYEGRKSLTSGFLLDYALAGTGRPSVLNATY